jgi:hypothetical protein
MLLFAILAIVSVLAVLLIASEPSGEGPDRAAKRERDVHS